MGNSEEHFDARLSYLCTKMGSRSAAASSCLSCMIELLLGIWTKSTMGDDPSSFWRITKDQYANFFDPQSFCSRISPPGVQISSFGPRIFGYH
jgi:hypothetical protein